VSEWTGPPDPDAILEFNTELVAVIEGKARKARAEELNAALREVLAGIWVEFETDRDRLLAEFELKTPREPSRSWARRSCPSSTGVGAQNFRPSTRASIFIPMVPSAPPSTRPRA
jgi:hypothetical protein